MDMVVKTISTLAIKLFEIVKPYVQVALGKLLEVVGGALPSWLGGNKMMNAGLAMQQRGIANDKTGIIPSFYGANAQQQLGDQITQNATSGALQTGGFKMGTDLLSGAAGAGMKQMVNVKDALITPHGIIKGDKGDMWMALQANGTGMNPGMNPGGGNSVVHSGTITLRSDDGKVVTWEQMHNAKDLLGGQMASIDKSYNGGFGNYHNSNVSPIRPLT